MEHSRFTLFGIPLQEEFDKYFDVAIHNLENWTDVALILEENPLIHLTDEHILKWVNTTIIKMDSLSALQFMHMYQNIEKTLKENPLWVRISPIFHDALIRLNHDKIKKSKKSNINKDLQIINRIIVTNDNSEISQKFVQNQPNTWATISHKEVINYEILIAIMPYITNPAIKTQMEEYLMMRLCKQVQLTQYHLWKDMTFSHFSSANTNYFSSAIQRFIRAYLHELEISNDDMISLLNITFIFNKPNSNFSIECFENIINKSIKNDNFILLEWFAEHHYDFYRNMLIQHTEKDILKYPKINKDSYSLEEITSNFPINAYKIPSWFKDLACYDQDIDIINRIYTDSLNDDIDLKIEHLATLLLVNLTNGNSIGIPESVHNFLNRNEHLFSALKTQIMNGEHRSEDSIQYYLLYSLLGGKNTILSHQQALQLIEPNRDSVFHMLNWPFSIIRNGYFQSFSLAMILPVEQEVLYFAYNENIETAFKNLNPALIPMHYFNLLKDFIYSKAFTPEELDLII